MPNLMPSPGQTVGPFFHAGLPFPGGNQLVGETQRGATRLHGTLYDGSGEGIPDALVELWQPDAAGGIVQRPGSLRRDAATFTGWGRTATDSCGNYEFTTLTPGSASRGGAAFFAITVFARGLLNRLFTRAYLPGGLDADPVLRRLDPARRETLICTTDSTGYRFDIHLQGARETVFLEYRSDPR